MAIVLPQKFEAKMKNLLGNEFDSFKASYDKPRKYGLRINELKISVSDWLQATPIQEYVKEIPWTTTGFYYEEQDRPAKHPHYQAGLYYIQEPSAMVPVELLDVKPGHRVLDLCAAPGGKSTQIASKLNNKGVLVTNDLATERTKPLAKNIELAGIRNAIILNETPERIAEVFPHYFDRVLVDAPCSGEGMFRKNEDMIAEWENFSVERCANMQDDILKVVAQMVAPGGKLVYSTCTFSPEENETQIANFLATHDDFDVVSIDASRWGWANGKSEWVDEQVKTKLTDQQLKMIDGTLRLWPHLTDGEGHFVAVLERRGLREYEENHTLSYTFEDVDWQQVKLSEAEKHEKLTKAKPNRREQFSSRTYTSQSQYTKSKHTKQTQQHDVNIKQLINQLCTDFVNIKLDSPMRATVLGTRIYLQPVDVPSLNKLKIVRSGWFIGEVKNNKFIPSQPFVMAIAKQEMLKYIQLDTNSEQLERFLRGETLFIDDVNLQGEYTKQNGYACVLVNNYVVGFVKIVDHMLKNEIPAGWRQLT